MSLAYQSIATINSPQFINLEPLEINPFMSACQIKVLYLGENRNKTFITKEVAEDMAKTLRGAPIVGYYKAQVDDFRDHGEEIRIDGDGIHFDCKTFPYGFVSPDAKVWFQDFQDQDSAGNKVVRTYLMTTGFLWTEQYQEAKKIFTQNGKPQSMELDKETLQGKWTENINNKMDFFIINDAIFTKLCILGDDVEPCFEGASITPPKVSSLFTLDQSFKTSLFNMLQDLKKYTLNKGGNIVANTNKQEEFVEEEKVVTEFTKDEQSVVEDQPASEFKKEDEKEKAKEDSTEEVDETDDDDDDKDEKKKEDKYALLQEEYSTLKASFDSLQTEIEELRQFKLQAEEKAKDEMINRFSMISDEDKKEIIENKSKYTVEEIEAKLALIGYRKGVNFNLEKDSENDNNQKLEEVITTYNVNSSNCVPEWVTKVEQTMKNVQ